MPSTKTTIGAFYYGASTVAARRPPTGTSSRYPEPPLMATVRGLEIMVSPVRVRVSPLTLNKVHVTSKKYLNQQHLQFGDVPVQQPGFEFQPWGVCKFRSIQGKTRRPTRTTPAPTAVARRRARW